MGRVMLRFAPEEPSQDTVILPASDTPNYYWYLDLEGMQVVWEVYIAVNQTEMKPTLFENKQHCLFIGVEQGVFVIDASRGTIVSQIVDTSYVQWIEQTSLGYVLVPAEDDLIAFAPSGVLLW